jgi:hypothetical protein
MVSAIYYKVIEVLLLQSLTLAHRENHPTVVVAEMMMMMMKV